MSFESSSGDPLLREIAVAVAASDFAKAAEIADAALGRGMAHPVLFNARALLSQHEGRHEDALSDFQRAFAFTPKDVTLLNAIGLCLVRVDRPKEAIAAFDSALRIAPAQAQTHYRKGWAHAASGDYDDARKCYERAVKLQPRHAEALGALAWIAARSGDTQKARSFAERALKIDPRQPTASGALAVVEIAEGSYEPAEQRLRPLLADATLDRQIRATLTGLLADALDGQDRIDDAFATYVAGNRELRTLNLSRYPETKRLSRQTSAIADWLDAMPREGWNDTTSREETDGPREHVFLMGFMRSGTTVLEQALATHPEVVSLEEHDTLSATRSEFLSGFEGLTRLASLHAEGLARARRTYWAAVSDLNVDVRNKVFIDKQPLATISLPLIARLFPESKILFAVRDPRDVIFSCFRRHFEIGPASFELLDLDDAAHFYDTAMRLAGMCRTQMTLHVFEHRYEDMIADFDRQIGSVCEFIGIEPLDAMRRFDLREHVIRSASAAQIRRGLYADGVGQWRRYASHLAPVLPLLQPWVERFGYAKG